MDNTPFYVFDNLVACSAFRQMSLDLNECLVHYCLKANGEAPVVNSLATAGARFEISSIHEFRTVARTGIAPEGILCGLPVKPAEMIRTLYEFGCRYFVFDSIDEFRKLERCAPHSKKVLRVNVCHISPEATAFGATREEIEGWIRAGMLPTSSVAGLAFDLRRNTTASAVLKALDLCEDLLNHFSCATTINIGGNYRMSWETEPDYYPTIGPRLASLRSRWPVTLLAEVGRSIIKHAGRLYASVTQVRRQRDQRSVYLDAGLPAGITHGPTFTRVVCPRTSQRSQDRVPCHFYGNTCCHTLLFSADLNFDPQPGDVLEMGGMGAYSVCKISHFHGFAPPRILYRGAEKDSLIHDGTWPTLASQPWEAENVLALN